MEPVPTRDLASLIDRYLDHRRVALRSRSTLGLYRRQLAAWVAFRQHQQLPAAIAAVTLDELHAYQAYLADTPSRGRLRQPATLASIYRTIRAFWRWCGRQGLLSADQLTFFDRLSAPRVPRKPRRAASTRLLRQLLDACGDPQAGGIDGEAAARNRAILLLLYESGARIAEVCQLTDGQIDLHARRAHIVGKGEKYRPIFWGPGAASALAQYLLVRMGPRRADLPLFRGTSIRNRGGAMTTDAVRAAVKRLAAAAGIDLPKGAPLHAFRHAFARRAIANGADISDVSKLLGHANLQTTMIYLEGDEEAMAQTYDRIFGRPARSPEARRRAEGSDR